MTIDDVQEMVVPTETLHERVSKLSRPVPIDMTSQYLGNRVRSTFYPDHWARVQIARATMQRWRTDA